jgi:uncharacterized repeat protein (TIGR03803 family)
MRHSQVLTSLLLGAIVCLGFSAYAGPPDLTLNVIYFFANGETPDAGVILGTNGIFYGTTSTGGPNNSGGVYEVSRDGFLVDEIWLDGTNGAAPMAPLIQGPGGNFLGTASRGGVGNNGTVFRFVAGGQIQLVAAFARTNGATPLAPLVEGTNGWLYGTTFNGGTNEMGGIFAITGEGAFTNLYSFGNTNAVGANPAAGLIRGTDGNLYGTTEYGGDNGLGTVFRLGYAGALTNLASFSKDTGAFPGELVEDAHGNFFGPATSGGFAMGGTIFKLNTSTNLEAFFTFGITNGDAPDSPLIAGRDGNWYGATEQGGASGSGTLFSLDTNGFLTELISFTNANGAYPRSGMVLGPDGNFYGTTSSGGAHGFGEIYELTGFPPQIITPPANQVWGKNAAANFSVTAGGSAPLSYQWQLDGTNLAGATDSTLTISHEELTNSGTYTVIVSNSYGEISTNALLSVTPPTIAITPLPATVSSASLTISGTANDPNGVATVLCQLNSNGWTAASGTTHWQTNVTLRPGTNLFEAESVDPVGNPSAIKRVTIFYATVSPLTLETNGLGAISAEFKGTNLTVGRGYTVQAVPGKDQLFSSWSGSLSATNNPLNFVMQSNMVLRANFITNPFIAAAGTYDGLFSASDGIAGQSAGLLRNLVIGPAGAYSGQLVLRGVAHGFMGRFDASAQSQTTVLRATDQGGSLALTLALNGDEVTGTVSGTDSGGWNSTLLAEQAAKSASAEYTMIIPPGPGAPTDCPPGYGYALLTNHNGLLTVNGATADGASFTESVSIVGAGDVPFYASLYGNTGLLFGWLNINGGLTETNVWWITPSASSAFYPGGFTNNFAILASAWTRPPTDLLPAGMLTISNTSIALDFPVSIINDTLAKLPGSPTNSLTGIFYPSTGLLKITFGNGAGRATTMGYAAILRDSTNGYGYFVTKTNAGTILLHP